MTLRAKVQACDPAVIEFFETAERAGYRVAWGHTQNLTLYHRNVLVGGWNSAGRHWYIAMRLLGGADSALADRHHFVRRPRGPNREVCTLGGAENLPHFQAAIEELIGVRIRA